MSLTPELCKVISHSRLFSIFLRLSRSRYTCKNKEDNYVITYIQYIPRNYIALYRNSSVTERFGPFRYTVGDKFLTYQR